MAVAKIQEILTAEMWSELTDRFKATYGSDSPVYLFLDSVEDGLPAFVSLDYAGLMTIVSTEVPVTTIADMAFLHMGDAFKRIFDTLTTNYDHLENFFTNGTFSKDGKETLEKKGTEKTQPFGSIKRETKGQSSSENDNSFSVSQGSTYDTATTTPPTTDAAANDLYNLGRNIQHNKVKSILGDGTGNNLPTETTSYDNHYVNRTFENRKDERTFDDYEETTNKRGNSGIFSKQDLTQREIRLRIKNRIVPIYVRMVVDTFSAGVWSDDN